MAIPASRDELLAAIDDSFAKLVGELDSVPAGRVDEPSLAGHARSTTMSVRDLVAYLTGWNELVLKWHRGRQAGLAVDFPETGFKWNELGRLAQKFYADYEGLTYEELRRRLADSKDQVRAIVESASSDGLYGIAWYEKWTLGRMIQFNSASPYRNARARLRTWKRTWSTP